MDEKDPYPNYFDDATEAVKRGDLVYALGVYDLVISIEDPKSALYARAKQLRDELYLQYGGREKILRGPPKARPPVTKVTCCSCGKATTSKTTCKGCGRPLCPKCRVKCALCKESFCVMCTAFIFPCCGAALCDDCNYVTPEYIAEPANGCVRCAKLLCPKCERERKVDDEYECLCPACFKGAEAEADRRRWEEIRDRSRRW